MSGISLNSGAAPQDSKRITKIERGVLRGHRREASRLALGSVKT